MKFSNKFANNPKNMGGGTSPLKSKQGVKRALLYILLPLICAVVCLGTVFSYFNFGKTTVANAASTTYGAYLDLGTGDKILNGFSGAQKENLYLGTYEGKPVKWRVLSVNDTTYASTATNTLLIFADYSMGTTYYDGYTDSNTASVNNTDAYYGSSKLRAYLNGGYYQTSATKFEGQILESDSLVAKILSGLNIDILKDTNTLTHLAVRYNVKQAMNNGVPPRLRTVLPNMARSMTSSTFKLFSYNTNNSIQKGGSSFNSKTGVSGSGGNSFTTFSSTNDYITHHTNNDKLFPLAIDDMYKVEYGFADESGRNYVNQVLPDNPSERLFSNSEVIDAINDYETNGYTAGYVTVYETSTEAYTNPNWPKMPDLATYGISYATYFAGSDNLDYWLRNTAKWDGKNRSCGFLVWKNHLDVDLAGSDTTAYGARPAAVMDTSKIGYVTPAAITNAFTAANSYSTAKPEYKLYAKGATMGVDSAKTKGFYSVSGNNLTISYNNPTSSTSGKMLVLLSDKTKSDGSVAYQAAFDISSSATAEHFESQTFALPAGVNASDYNVSMLFTSDTESTYTSGGVNATETIYASYPLTDGIAAPQNINGLEYDGESKWIDNLGDKSPDWVKTDIYCNATYMSVSKIMYTAPSASEAKDVTAKGVNEIKAAGAYAVTFKLATGYNWAGESDSVTEKTFTINIGKKSIGSFIPQIVYAKNDDGTTKIYYEGWGTDKFPEIKPPTEWDGKGVITWDSGQTLSSNSETKYKWTFKPKDTSWADKTGESTLTVEKVKIGKITATYSGTATDNVYTSTSLADLLKLISVTKTKNDGSDGGPAAASELEFADITSLSGKAGTNVEFTVRLKDDTSVSTTVTIPEIKAVAPVALDVAHDGSAVYPTTDEATLKGQLTVKLKNNDGTTGKTLETTEYKFGDDFELTDGAYTLNVYLASNTEVTGSVQLTVLSSAVKSVAIKEVTVPEGVTLWEGAAANTIKAYLTVEVVFDDGKDTKKTLSATDNFNVNVMGSEKNVLTAGQCGFTVTYGGKKSGAKAVTVQGIEVTELSALYIQGDRKIYSSAKLEALDCGTYLSVDAKFNNDTESTLDPEDYTVTLPENFSSTNNLVTVAWKKDPTKKTTFPVTVTDVVPVSVAATVSDGAKFNALNKLDDLKSGLSVTLTYNDGNNKTLKAEEYTLEIAESELHSDGCLCAGSRTVTVKYGTDITATFPVTVDEADYPEADKIVFDDFTFTFGGEINVEATNLPAGVTAKYLYNGSETVPTEIGDYTVTVTFTHDNPNYKEIPLMSATLTITDKTLYKKGDLTVTGEGIAVDGKNLTATYKGGAFTIAAAGAVKDQEGNEVTSEYTTTVTFKQDGEEVTEIKNVGKYDVIVKYTMPVDGVYAEYEESFEVKYHLTVGKADFVLADNGLTFEDKSVEYDGEAHSIEIAGEIPEWLTVTYEGNGTEPDTYTVTAKFEHSNPNYNVIANATSTLTITKAKISVPEYTGNLTYTGESVMPTGSDFKGFDANIMEFESVSGINAGNGYKATFTLKDTEHYEWADGKNEADWTIAKAKIVATRTEGSLPQYSSESYKGKYDSIVKYKYYTDNTCTTEVNPDELVPGTEYYVKAELSDDTNFELEDSAQVYFKGVFKHTVAGTAVEPPAPTTESSSNSWIWIVIGVGGALLLLTLIIVLSRRRAHAGYDDEYDQDYDYDDEEEDEDYEEDEEEYDE